MDDHTSITHAHIRIGEEQSLLLFSFSFLLYVFSVHVGGGGISYYGLIQQ